MNEQQITCLECHEPFIFTESEQAFYEARGLASPPKRCKECRLARKASRPGDARGGSMGGSGRGGHHSDANAYRSPMSTGGAPSQYRSPSFAGEPAWGRAPSADTSRPRRDGDTRTARAPREDRPRYDVICANCGGTAQVPFRPLAGRDVFCPNCYRARRGQNEQRAVDPIDLLDTDSGIIE